MSDRPITFSPAMVRALLAGTKTQTRRGLTLPKFRKFTEFGPSDTKGYDWHLRDARMLWNDFTHARLLELLPHQAGDRLYVRERWRTWEGYDAIAPRDLSGPVGLWYEADNRPDLGVVAGRFRQAMHMPKWASRITLHVSEVRVQRLQEISEADALAEGIRFITDIPGVRFGVDIKDDLIAGGSTAVDAYRVLWATVNGEANMPIGTGSWYENPWVSCTSFTVEHCHIDQARAA